MKLIFGGNKQKEEYVVPAMEIYKFPVGSDVFLTLSDEDGRDNNFDAGDLGNF